MPTLLSERGIQIEKEVIDQIKLDFGKVEDLDGQPLLPLLLSSHDQPQIFSQATIHGQFGDRTCEGKPDLVYLQPNPNGELDLFVADIKASRKAKISHQLQVAIYIELIKQIADRNEIKISRIDGDLLYLGENGELPKFDPFGSSCSPEDFRVTLDRIAVGENNDVDRVAKSKLEKTPYHIGGWCDRCQYNSICSIDSAQRRDLSLIPYLTTQQKRKLISADLTQFQHVADLFRFDDNKLVPRDLEKIDQLKLVSVLNKNLDQIVQRAKRVTDHFDKTDHSLPYLIRSDFGKLSCDTTHDDLIKIFIDVQFDIIQDRIYLISAIVIENDREKSFAKMTEKPPIELDEKNLLIKFIDFVLDAIAIDEAKIHFYFYDNYSHKLLIEALDRHTENDPKFLAFLDLLTETEAVGQQMIAILHDELRDAKNQGLTCPSIYHTAEVEGFDWRSFKGLFRIDIFDTKHDLVVDQKQIAINGVSRFTSQTPIEYAYGAWGELEIYKNSRSKLIRHSRKIRPKQLESFSRHRTKALILLEKRLKQKNEKIEKFPIQLDPIRRSELKLITLQNSMIEYLKIEHHVNQLEMNDLYRQPLSDRILDGRSMRLRCEAIDGNSITFKILNPLRIDLSIVEFKEGDWIVVNSVDLPPWKTKNGQLATITSFQNGEIVLQKRWISHKNSEFKFWHRQINFTENHVYAISKMADDLNADKAREAIENADKNSLYRILHESPPINSETIDHEFLELVAEIEHDKTLTEKQSAVINSDSPIVLVQGPPGTGKSYTLAWAILRRIYRSWREDRPITVAVSCATHNAVLVVLEEIADKCDQLRKFMPNFPIFPIFKIANEDAFGDLPCGIEGFDCYADQGNYAIGEMTAINPISIFGGTPGGFYNLARYDGNLKEIDWSLNYFDLLVIDEASQMPLPFAILSGAFLRRNGDLIVVGDHRQMPPIQKHNWDEELRPSAKFGKPYLSIFESLIDRGFEAIRLDQSFRLPRSLADFLREQIYSADKINFHSKVARSIKPTTTNDEYVKAVLRRDHPIVVVEHDEARSEKYNPTEIALITPLIDTLTNELGLDPRDGLGVVVPHRSQRSELNHRFPHLAKHSAIDTVERFQGGERDVIIVSATVSDPEFVRSESEFLLNLNRLNVAISRPKKKLIVIASKSITQFLADDLDLFEKSKFWQTLFYRCVNETLWSGSRSGHRISVRGRSLEIE